MSIVLQDLVGNRYNLEEYGIKSLGLIISSPNPIHNTEKIEGRHGHIDMGTTFEGRSLKGRFMLKAKDRLDYLLLRDEIFGLFDGRKFFYLIETDQPKRRWKVKTASAYDIERITSRVGQFEIQFISPLPFAESFGTTLAPFDFNNELWAVGQGVISEDLKYVYNTPNFSIYNGSDVEIDPRELPLLITFKGASSNLKITNKTTGDGWKLAGTTNASDVIALNGVKSLKNGVSIFGNTNRKILSLAKGFNNFTIEGASNFEIKFDFRFYNF
ncbi:MAG TPA: phage tail family protein [Bacillus bacterium]|nr:phage tail family protein [Bacillus sp. (in: firmicutes)]